MAEDKGLADIAARFADAWNRHDMAAFAALFHADASFVNRFGTYWRGVEQIVAGHVPIHETIYSDSTLTTRSQTSMPSAPMPRSCISGRGWKQGRRTPQGRTGSTR